MLCFKFQQKELLHEQEKMKLQEHYETHLSHLKRWVWLQLGALQLEF